MGDGVSVVIPTGGRGRLHLLDTMLGWLRRCDGVYQVILSELGDEPAALELARRWDADHVFTPMCGHFDRAAARNAGIALARADTLLWCDGDLIFGGDFVRCAQRELDARQLDYLAPFSTIDYLDETQTSAVIAGQCTPESCRPLRVLGAMWNGAPGGMWLVRRDFLRRHGGFPGGFKGWGQEDDAWLHKAGLLGRIGASEQAGQRAWHLFHPDSGSHSSAAGASAMRANPHYAHNRTLLDRIFAVRDAETWQHEFPLPPHGAPPWHHAARIAFVAVAGSRDAGRAEQWAARLHAAYGVDVPVHRDTPVALPATVAALPADIVVGFAGTAADHAVLAAAGAAVAMLVVADGVPATPWGNGAPPVIVVRHAAAIAAWRQAGYSVWHRPWDEASGEGAVPGLVQPLSHLLACPRDWQVRIVIDRAALAPSALDSARFWYVGLHDAQDVELMREDLRGNELRSAVATVDGPIVISRAVRSTRRPARWTVWPTDRRGYWLDRLSGEIGADALTAGGPT